MKRLRGMIFVAALGLVPASATAQMAAPAPSAQAQINGREVVAAVRQLLNSHYVLPDVRPKLDAALAKGLADGHYDVADPNELAKRIDADLHQVTPDKHLGVMFDPERSKALAAAGPNVDADDPPPTPDDIREAVRRNHGISELKILPGNVRYMRYDGFVLAGPKTAEALDTAMRFLRDGDAAIIDLRGNGGGSPEAVQYLVSHFLAPKQKIVTFYMGGKPAESFSTLASLPTARMVGKPLYVLTSGGTASAAEEFTGHVAGFKLGELIGENTAGAGFRNNFYPLPDGMIISISVGRAVLASTGKDWEGVGFAPNTKVDVDKALDVAEVHAWRKLAATATGDDKRLLDAQAALLEAKTNPVATALPLAAYAGTYGERTVSLSGSGLVWQRGTNPKITMVPIGANEFTFDDDPTTRIRFDVAGGSVTGLHMLRGDGSTLDAQRAQ